MFINKQYIINKIYRYFSIFFLFVIMFFANTAEALVWYEKNVNNEPIIHFYFFWSEKCPHCLQAEPDINEMAKEYPWLKLHSLELVNNPDNVQKFISMAEWFGNDARSVPTFMFCGNLISGYENKITTGEMLRKHLLGCYEFVKEKKPQASVVYELNKKDLNSIDIPLLGEIFLDEYSLPVLTVFIAGMDAFNPCAFFVLLFLLSMMVHGRSRRRIALIGMVFVFFSGAMYFLFMAAWLNLFLYLGELRLITLVAGVVAVLVSLINIKDYFWFKRGITLSISDNKKPALFERMRYLLRLDSIVTVIVATIILAIVANSYELLCTAGFPMIYTRVLTLNSLSTESYYLYLLLYNFIYVLPLMCIVIIFTVKLGSRKLAEHEGMILKLLSGIMMLLLGLLLIFSPQLLSNIAVAALILLLAISMTWLIVKFRLHGVQKND